MSISEKTAKGIYRRFKETQIGELCKAYFDSLCEIKRLKLEIKKLESENKNERKTE